VSFISAFVSAWDAFRSNGVNIGKVPNESRAATSADLGFCGLASYRSTSRMSDIYYAIFSVTSNQPKEIQRKWESFESWHRCY